MRSILIQNYPDGALEIHLMENQVVMNTIITFELSEHIMELLEWMRGND